MVSAVTSSGAEAVEREGGKLFGLFLPQIGLAASEGILLTLWPDTGRESPILTGAEDNSGAREAMQRFVRRHELTEFTIVVTTELGSR